ncbi:MAG: flagellar protein FlgN [Pedosphaera sp.]|nr:flagellar protein FlgN [Pedosphaera sp.]
MSRGLEQLIGTLRDELTECGELLALLEEQQSFIIVRSTEGLLKNIEQVNVQFEKVSAVRQLREENQRRYAVEIGFPVASSFGDISGRVAAEYRPLLGALVEEINGVLENLHQWLRQNYRLLGRSLDLLQQLIKGLFPTTVGSTYSRRGYLTPTAPPPSTLYNGLI